MTKTKPKYCRLCGTEIPKNQHACSPCLSEAVKKLRREQKEPLAFKVDRAREILGRLNDRPAAINISGGKGSTVLAHLALKYLPRQTISFWFGDTRLELPETYRFIKMINAKWDLNLNWIRTPYSPWKVFKKHGWPIGGKSRRSRIPEVYEKIHTSDYCCDLLKHGPIDKARRDANLKTLVLGIQADESTQRRLNYAAFGPFHTAKRDGLTKVHPLAIWRDKDIWDYIRENNLPYCTIYDMGYDRNGCFACAMGAIGLAYLKELHPRHFALLERKGMIAEVKRYIEVVKKVKPRSPWARVQL